MAKDDPHFRLRIPADLKAQVEDAAQANNRSINAEIISRIEQTFSQDWFTEDKLTDTVNETLAASQKTLYVALDAEGLPISWQEIMTHLGEIGRAGGFDIRSINAEVVSPKMIRNSEREPEWWKLVQHYRKLRAKKRTQT